MQLWDNHWLVKTGYVQSGKSREVLPEELHSKPDTSRWDSLLYNGHQVIAGGKAAGVWRWPPTPSSAKVKERGELYTYAPSAPSWPTIERILPAPLRLPFTCSFIPTQKVPWRWAHHRNRREVTVRLLESMGSRVQISAGRPTTLNDIYRGFLLPFQVNAMTVSQVRPRSLHFTHFPIYYLINILSFDLSHMNSVLFFPRYFFKINVNVILTKVL